jgi:hypothetical protein
MRLTDRYVLFGFKSGVISDRQSGRIIFSIIIVSCLCNNDMAYRQPQTLDTVKRHQAQLFWNVQRGKSREEAVLAYFKISCAFINGTGGKKRARIADGPPDAMQSNL